MQMSAKTSSSTAITMSQIVLPYNANLAGNMHGGEVMKIMDSAAGAVAARHCLTNVVTASVTQLSFIEPVFVGDLVICNAQLIYTGRTSMEIFVDVKAEDLGKGIIRCVSEGYFVMVSLDRNGHPSEVPPLQIENEQQQIIFDEAKRRIAQMKQQKRESSRIAPLK